MKLAPRSILVVLIGLMVLMSDTAPQLRVVHATTVSAQTPLEGNAIYLPLVAHNYCADAYTDDFSDPNSGWLVGNFRIFELSYQEGEYEIVLRQANSVAGAPAPISGLTQYSVEADVHRQTGSASQYALAFDLVDFEHFYIFLVDPQSQNYAIGKRDGSNWVVVAAWSYSPYIHPNSERNHLTVTRYGSQITVSINDRPLTTAFGGTYSGNLGVGVYAQTGSDVPAAVRFDNFRVCGGTTSTLAGASVTPAEKASIIDQSLGSGLAIAPDWGESTQADGIFAPPPVVAK